MAGETSIPSHLFNHRVLTWQVIRDTFAWPIGFVTEGQSVVTSGLEKVTIAV